MDANCVTSKPKRQKTDENGRGRSLNEFHDDILLHILSFLPTKAAIGSSILSKRWQYLWTSIPILDFTQEADLMNFIQKSLSLRHRGSSKISKFKLACHIYASPPIMALWYNVEECELVNLSLPYQFYLPRLKVLKLLNVNFLTPHSNRSLFIGCPRLEHIELECCHWWNVKAVCIFSDKLQRLIIKEAIYVSGPFIGYDFAIHARGLRHFSYRGPFYYDYFMLTSALEEVTIDAFPWPPNSTHVSNRLLKLLRRVSNVPKLTLGVSSISLLTQNPEFRDDMPKFSNLTHLELNAKMDPLDLVDPVWLKILKSIPHLKRLVLSGINDSWLLRHLCLYVSSSTTRT